MYSPNILPFFLVWSTSILYVALTNQSSDLFYFCFYPCMLISFWPTAWACYCFHLGDCQSSNSSVKIWPWYSQQYFVFTSLECYIYINIYSLQWLSILQTRGFKIKTINVRHWKEVQHYAFRGLEKGWK